MQSRVKFVRCNTSESKLFSVMFHSCVQSAVKYNEVSVLPTPCKLMKDIKDVAWLIQWFQFYISLNPCPSCLFAFQLNTVNESNND